MSAENCRSLLSDNLTAFLEQARIPKTGDSLFFYVYGFAPPERLWQTFEWMYEGENKHRHLTLFLANSGPSHPDGLVFDQTTNKAIVQMSIHDTSITHNGRIPWFPLEVVLSAWLDMVDVGKIKAVDDSVEALSKFGPWICCHWSDFVVQETVDAFNALVDSIESRMRNQGLLVSDGTVPLLPESTLEAADIPPGFAHCFLTKACRPSFRYLAPGLSVPDQDSFLQQPFACVVNTDQDEDADENEIYIKPILLFASPETFNLANKDDREDFPFMYPYSEIQSFPAGLYLTSSERQMGHEFEDAVRLVLPFGIGGNGFARTSDGLQIGDRQDNEEPSCADRHADLYQPGWNPFIEMHEVRLVKVLESWKAMVERGDWKVGAEGVQGTIEAFKEADTEQNWRKFVVSIGW